MPEEEKALMEKTTKVKGSFKGKIKDITKFADAIASIGEIIDEGIFRVSGKGFGLIAADRAMVAVCDFLYKKEGFESFELATDKELLVGLNVQDLIKTIKRFSGEVTFECTEEDNKFYIYDNEKKFNIPILDMSLEEVPPINQLEFAGELEMDINKFRGIIDDSAIVGDALVFDIKPDKVNIRASGDIKGYNIELARSENIVMSFEKETKAMFSLDYLAKVVKSNIGEKIKLSLATDHPVKVTATSDIAYLTWVMAPRVMEE